MRGGELGSQLLRDAHVQLGEIGQCGGPRCWPLATVLCVRGRCRRFGASWLAFGARFAGAPLIHWCAFLSLWRFEVSSPPLRCWCLHLCDVVSATLFHGAAEDLGPLIKFLWNIPKMRGAGFYSRHYRSGAPCREPLTAVLYARGCCRRSGALSAHAAQFSLSMGAHPAVVWVTSVLLVWGKAGFAVHQKKKLLATLSIASTMSCHAMGTSQFRITIYHFEVFHMLAVHHHAGRKKYRRGGTDNVSRSPGVAQK